MRTDKPNMLNPYVLPLTEPTSPFIEHYRRLYRKILYFYQKNEFQSFGITSAQIGEGKTLTTINLALTMSEDPTRTVVLVDCDFRKPRTAQYLGLPAKRGLAEVLEGKEDLKDVVMTIKNGSIHLKIITAGRVEGNPMHLFHEDGLRTVLKRLKAEYSFVLVDTPPILPIADQVFLADLVDGLILVIRAGKAPREMIKTALENIAEKNVVGIIFNGYQKSVANYYHYKYSSYYSRQQK